MTRSAPASRALDAAVRLLRGRPGCIDVVWVAHLSSTVRLSAGAVVELIVVAAGIRDARPGQNVVIVIGSSSHATDRMVGSVAVSLARHSPVPLLIVP